MINNASLSDIADRLRSKNRIAALIHNSTDGDTLGSAVAVSLALKKLGKDVTLVHEEGFVEHLSPILYDQSFFLRVGDDAKEMDRLSWDTVIVFDTADRKLLGKRAQLLKQTECVINIDHHMTNQIYGDLNYIKSDEAATAVIAFDLIAELGVEIDKDMALAIYTGICTDTGGFSYANTTARCHIVAARTIEFGIDVAKLRYIFFDAISTAKLKCQSYVASNLKFYDKNTVALAVLSRDTLVSLGADESDCDGLVNIGSNVVGVTMSMLAREIRDGEFRINLRSRGERDVAAAARIFGGGGHKNAAGCTIKASKDEIAELLTRNIMPIA